MTTTNLAESILCCDSAVVVNSPQFQEAFLWHKRKACCSGVALVDLKKVPRRPRSSYSYRGRPFRYNVEVMLVSLLFRFLLILSHIRALGKKSNRFILLFHLVSALLESLTSNGENAGIEVVTFNHYFCHNKKCILFP